MFSRCAFFQANLCRWSHKTNLCPSELFVSRTKHKRRWNLHIILENTSLFHKISSFATILTDGIRKKNECSINALVKSDVASKIAQKELTLKRFYINLKITSYNAKQRHLQRLWRLEPVKRMDVQSKHYVNNRTRKTSVETNVSYVAQNIRGVEICI